VAVAEAGIAEAVVEAATAATKSTSTLRIETGSNDGAGVRVVEAVPNPLDRNVAFALPAFD